MGTGSVKFPVLAFLTIMCMCDAPMKGSILIHGTIALKVGSIFANLPMGI